RLKYHHADQQLTSRFPKKALRKEGHKAQKKKTQPFAPSDFPFLAPLRETPTILNFMFSKEANTLEKRDKRKLLLISCAAVSLSRQPGS
ncbi:MAG: hypothetical protein ABI596_03870, partial [Pyrinomonadaceae bacterium]